MYCIKFQLKLSLHCVVTFFLLFSISSTVHMYKHTEANMTKKYSDTFRATIPRLGTNKKDNTPQVCAISWTFIKF